MLRLNIGSGMLRLGLRLSIGSCMLRLGLRLGPRLRLKFQAFDLGVSILCLHTGGSLGRTPRNILRGWPRMA